MAMEIKRNDNFTEDKQISLILTIKEQSSKMFVELLNAWKTTPYPSLANSIVIWSTVKMHV